MIPNIIHFVWIGPQMPWWARNNIDLFRKLNPSYEVKVHGIEVLLRSFRHAYNKVEGSHLQARRSDVLRVCALLRYGGWYFDTDFLPVRPLDDIRADFQGLPRDCLIAHGIPESHMANGVFITASNGEFLDHVAMAIIREADLKGPLSWGTYGPKIFTELHSRFPDNHHASISRLFFPVVTHTDAALCYKRLCAAGCSPQAVFREFGDRPPYMLHTHQADRLTL